MGRGRFPPKEAWLYEPPPARKLARASTHVVRSLAGVRPHAVVGVFSVQAITCPNFCPREPT